MQRTHDPISRTKLLSGPVRDKSHVAVDRYCHRDMLSDPNRDILLGRRYIGYFVGIESHELRSFHIVSVALRNKCFLLVR